MNESSSPFSDKKPGLRSPLKEPPRRQAGQSLDERIQELRLDLFGQWILGSIALIFAAFEWYRHFIRDQFHP